MKIQISRFSVPVLAMLASLIAFSGCENMELSDDEGNQVTPHKTMRPPMDDQFDQENRLVEFSGTISKVSQTSLTIIDEKGIEHTFLIDPLVRVDIQEKPATIADLAKDSKVVVLATLDEDLKTAKTIQADVSSENDQPDSTGDEEGDQSPENQALDTEPTRIEGTIQQVSESDLVVVDHLGKSHVFSLAEATVKLDGEEATVGNLLPEQHVLVEQTYTPTDGFSTIIHATSR